MTAKVDGSDGGNAWADGDDWSLELASLGVKKSSIIKEGSLWIRLSEGKRRD